MTQAKNKHNRDLTDFGDSDNHLKTNYRIKKIIPSRNADVTELLYQRFLTIANNQR